MYAPNMKSQYEAFLELVEVALRETTSSSESLVLLGDALHRWALIMQLEKVLLDSMVTLT